MLVNFENGHSTVIGITRSGKTYATKKSLEKVKEGVIFFNTQYEEMPSSFIKVNAKDDIKVIINALKANKKINYVPQLDSIVRDKELIYLIDSLYRRDSEKRIYLVVDEVHLYEKESLKALIKIATTGLRFGVHGIWISQRPANIDNTLMTQSNQFIIFKTNMENGYFDRYGIPAEEIKSRLKEDYSYCIYDFMEVRGAFKV